MNTNDLTVTDASLIRKLSNVIVEGNKLRGDGETREEVKDSLRLKQGVLLKYYTGSDKALVQLNDMNRKVLCKIIHPMISSTMNISYIPRGYETSDNIGFYIEPYETHHVLCLEIEHGSNDTELGLLGFICLDEQSIASNGFNGEVNIKVGDSEVCISSDMINIRTNNVFWNGMPLSLPKFDNIYEKTDVDDTITNVKSTIGDVNTSFGERLNRLESIVLNLTETEDTDNNLFSDTSLVNFMVDLKKTTPNILSQGEKLTCTINNNNTNKIITGLNVNAKLTRINTAETKTYNIISDINGECSLPVNLSKGDYSIVWFVDESLNYNYSKSDKYYFTIQ